MLERRTMAAVAGVLVLLGVVLTLLLTASEDSALGRVRAHVGDAADSVADAISVPSATPTPTAPPSPDAAQVRSRETAAEVRALLASAGTALDRGDAAGRVAALRDYDRVRALFALEVLREEDGYQQLYDEASALKKRLMEAPVVSPQPSSASVASVKPRA